MMAQKTISEIANEVFLTQLESIQTHLDGCIAGEDPIHLHDLRVANRRTREAIREFRGLLSEEVFLQYQKDFRWIHKITGEVRDLDVSLAHIPGYLKAMPKEWRPFLNPMQELLEHKRSKAQQLLSKKLRSERVQDILSSWFHYLNSDQFGIGPTSQEPASEVGCRMIVKRYRKLRKRGKKLRKKTPAEKFHSYRINIKRLRYLMEFLRSEIDSDVYTKLRTGLKSVQDAFGAFQDADVQRERLLEVASELNQAGASTETLLALGQLIGILEKKIKQSKKNCLRKVRWFVSDPTARSFQACFQYPVNK
jgi:CHAD domain-containing protein